MTSAHSAASFKYFSSLNTWQNEVRWKVKPGTKDELTTTAVNTARQSSVWSDDLDPVEPQIQDSCQHPESSECCERLVFCNLAHTGICARLVCRENYFFILTYIKLNQNYHHVVNTSVHQSCCSLQPYLSKLI